MAFLKVASTLKEERYRKEIVFEELLPRWAYSDSEWKDIISESEFMGQGGRYIDVEKLPPPPPVTNYFGNK